PPPAARLGLAQNPASADHGRAPSRHQDPASARARTRSAGPGAMGALAGRRSSGGLAVSSGLWFAVALALWTLTTVLAFSLKHRTGWPDFYEIERQRRERERVEWERERREWERALAIFRGGK